MQKAIANNANKTNLTRKETREIITPYAFHVSPDLLGIPLATPAQRGWSMLIDLILVGLLTQVSSLVLAGVAAFTFFRAGNRLKRKKRFNAVRIVLRFVTAVLLFVVALGVFDEFNDNSSNTRSFSQLDSDGIELSNVDNLEVLGTTAKYFIRTAQLIEDIEEGECQDAYACWQDMGEQLSEDIAQLALPKDKAFGVLSKFVEVSEDSLTGQQMLSLKLHLEDDFEQRVSVTNITLDSSQNASNTALKSPNTDTNQQADNVTKSAVNNTGKEKDFMEWVEKVAEDFGWGVGWALFYFSLFTAWWKGQTPGKRLMGIKVIKLNGNVLNLWESFGRYGGYSAGLATGLSGFLQVYWDPNRQAIQDKVSETFVINLRKPKVPFELHTESNLTEMED
ncbi:MAG: hypothetical protein ACI88A_003572 [Paraglaciecola sp.]|jgi:hypothetical protein